ncbi:hypothetical protein F751_6705 [Auxenochlorella protothecoides]|uniref:Uncharacterized protein n=1 Tax=Auxenochlorella protothecoides TaxID=3075 RepID=A0A087SQM6_AUXPR|nr:hypothetical protein F751_6705 [Auxenochlorella protothecoides]KFM28030.1 hypothetical protein F751_6705 [Auxenochlorella protothecoides]
MLPHQRRLPRHHHRLALGVHQLAVAVRRSFLQVPLRAGGGGGAGAARRRAQHQLGTHRPVQQLPHDFHVPGPGGVLPRAAAVLVQLVPGRAGGCGRRCRGECPVRSPAGTPDLHAENASPPRPCHSHSSAATDSASPAAAAAIRGVWPP